MKQRLADFIADFLADNGVRDVFSVVGGGAMHLNNAFGTSERLNVRYNHHEQASAIAAESYSRIHNEIAAVCVTSGPGGTNALTGVLCAYQDSLPMLVISGQVRYDLTVESTGLDLRQFGEQEYHIIRSVEPMTKYSVMIKDASTIKYHLGKALYLARTGRRGPCWIDVPLNIQGQIIETDDLQEFIPDEKMPPSKSAIDQIIAAIKQSIRPVIVAGSSIRTSGGLESFYNLADKLGLPVICPTSTVDVMPLSNPNYYGMFGSFGGRTGNFLVQNADLIISLGARLSFKQIGFNFKAFAPHAKKIVVDIDSEELKKPTLSIDLPVCADVKDIIDALYRCDFDCNIEQKSNWLSYCEFLKEKFSEPHYPERDTISAYPFADKLMQSLGEKDIVVLGNNCAAVSMLQSGIKKQGQRMFGNVNCGTMGYDLPAAIGASVASGGAAFCVTGEGSFQMNLQELQTIVQNNLPVKIVIFNNNAYQAIVQTQTNFFKAHFSGCTAESGVSFPSFEKLAYCYDFPFRSIATHAEIASAVEWLVQIPGRAMLELVQTAPDPILPKLGSKRMDDGSIISPPIDDISPFLPEDEYAQCQYENYVSNLKRGN